MLSLVNGHAVTGGGVGREAAKVGQAEATMGREGKVVATTFIL